MNLTDQFKKMKIDFFKNSKKIGTISILCASTMWALEPVFAKLAYANSDFLQTSAIRAIFVLLTTTLFLLIQKNQLKDNLKINRQQITALIYIGVVATIIADLLYFFALSKTSVINAVIISHMQPIFIILLGFFILKEEKLGKQDYLGIFIMIIAGLLVSTKTLSNFCKLKFGTIYDLIIILATIGWTTTTLTMKKYLKNLSATSITFYRYLVASIIFVVYLSTTTSIKISNIYQVLTGISVGIGTILYYTGLKSIKAAQVTALELSTPFFATILSIFILKETLTLIQFLGIIMLITGIYLLSNKE